MLGYVIAEEPGVTDDLMRAVADQLRARDLHVIGAVQVNLEVAPDTKCHMDLHILNGAEVVRISQNLGALSKGCRLDPDGLERAVGMVATHVESGADILIVNKFGKQEADGRGFRPVIGEALSAGIPVLTGVGKSNLEAFLEFAGEFAEPLPNTAENVVDWSLSHVEKS